MKNIENKFLIEIKNCELNLWDEEEQNEHVKECVKIADDFAIGFAHFLGEHTYSCYENGWSNDFGHKELTTKELLEIYKKEKGL